MLADRAVHLPPLRGVGGGRGERRGPDPEALDPDPDPRFVHERQDPVPAVARPAERLRFGAVEHERAGRRSTDGELVLGALDDVVTVRAIGDEEAEPVEAARAAHGAREHDDEIAVARADELLSTVQRPATVALGRLRRDLPDVGAGLRLGHRDRADDLAASEPWDVPPLLLFGPVAHDHGGGRRVEGELHHRARAGPREHLDDEGREREGQPAAAVLARQRKPDEPKVGEALEVRLERLVHLDPAVVAHDPDRVDRARARRDLGADVAAGDGEHLAPRRHRLRDVGLRPLGEPDHALPRHAAVERGDEVGIVEEEVHR